MRRLLLVLGMALIGCASDAPTSALTPRLRSASSAVGDSSYIVVLRDQAGNPMAFAMAQGITPKFVYRRVLRGFAASLNAAAVDGLRHNPNVVTVTPDGMVYPTTEQTPAPSWGLDRIDQRWLPLDGRYTFASDGTGVQFYDIDTGIRTDHADFAGRIGLGVNLSGASGGVEDCNGHGTHTAGTVAGTTYGVAKNVTIHPVRVFGCTGGAATSVIIAAVDWVTTNATLPAVVNMSLGGSFDAAMNQAVANSVASGIVYAVAAGNANADACGTSPASVPSAITVGAAGADDSRAYFSNYGSCVDLYAPGVSITSDWYSSSTATFVASGTSMATPHVAGAAALILSLNPTMSPAAVASLIAARSTKRALKDPSLDGDLLYTGTDTMATPPGSKPVASFAYSCFYTTCAFTDRSTSSAGIVSWSWSFGSTEQSPTATFHYGNQVGACCYTETVRLAVVDAAGFSGAYTVKIATTSPIALTATAAKSQGTNIGQIRWSGVRGDSVFLYRTDPNTNTHIGRWVANTGAFDDTLPSGKVTVGRNRNGFYYQLNERTSFADWQATMPVVLR